MSKKYWITIQLNDSISEAQTLETTVEDTGIGMSQEFLPHLFDAFSREKNTTAAKVPGTGLGMPIVKKMAGLKGKHLLLAEDNELNAEIAIAILEGMGFQVDLAVDGIECVDKLQQSAADAYDLILMDIQMPNMDGYKATQVIRRLPDPKKANIPIVAMTANAFEEDKKMAFEKGMNGHIAKPVDVSKMQETIALVLKNQE